MPLLWRKTVRDSKRGLLQLVAAIVIYCGIMWIWKLPCPIRWLTGISCAGCGMTRAWLCVCSGQLLNAFAFHPLWPIPLVMLVLFVARKKISSQLTRRLYGTAVLLFLVVYVLRMINKNDPVISFDPRNGALEKAWTIVYLAVVRGK